MFFAILPKNEEELGLNMKTMLYQEWNEEWKNYMKNENEEWQRISEYLPEIFVPLNVISDKIKMKHKVIKLFSHWTETYNTGSFLHLMTASLPSDSVLPAAHGQHTVTGKQRDLGPSQI